MISDGLEADSIPPLLELRHVSRTYTLASGMRVEALRDVSIQICTGEFIAVVGQSGSGKTTLMNIIGCLDRPTDGDYVLMGRNVRELVADELARLRREMFGFVFQNYNLIATETARENIEVPGLYSGIPRSERAGRASELLANLGLAECGDRPPSQLSGGQQQRTAIARALMNGGRIILADEPTGALDSHTGLEVIRELKQLAESGHTVILITHDPRVAAMATRRIELLDGSITRDDGPSRAQAFTEVRVRSEISGALRSEAGFFSGGLEMLRTAARSLRNNLLRTSLTLLGILIGVGSVVALMFIAESSRMQVMDSVYAAGADLITVRPSSRAAGSPAELTMEDARSIIAEVPNIESVLPEIRAHLRVQRGARNMLSPVTATASTLPQVRDWRLASGTFFLEVDGDRYEPVAVIGAEVRGELFREADPIGQYMLIGTELFLVIGVMEEKGGFWGAELDKSVFVPLRTGSARLIGRWPLDSMTVEITDPELAERTAAAVKSLLERWHGEDAVDVRLNAALLAASAQVLNTFSLLLGSIAGISLLVGGIGIMNMLLTSVTERTREIGIRMAVGARQSDILRQFLAEAIIISTAGALAGLVVGAVVGNLVIHFSGGEPLFTAIPIVLALASALVIGLVFGYAPARRAARMDPARALAWE